jgi:signal peptidase II
LRKLKVLGATVVPVLLLDIGTKLWALDYLAGRPVELFGGLIPLTLAFNRGAAFGLSIGSDPRWFFIPVSILALVLLSVLLYQARDDDFLRLLSLSLVISGAVGNLIDRVRWDSGVVDFIGPIDLGFMDWPIFNVADSCITCGAILLALSFWLESKREEAGRTAVVSGADSGAEA